jgi:hypothetical protein
VHWELDDLHFSAAGSKTLGQRLAPRVSAWLQQLADMKGTTEDEPKPTPLGTTCSNAKPTETCNSTLASGTKFGSSVNIELITTPRASNSTESKALSQVIYTPAKTERTNLPTLLGSRRTENTSDKIGLKPSPKGGIRSIAAPVGENSSLTAARKGTGYCSKGAQQVGSIADQTALLSGNATPSAAGSVISFGDRKTSLGRGEVMARQASCSFALAQSRSSARPSPFSQLSKAPSRVLVR